MKKMYQSAGSQRVTCLISVLAATFLFSGCVGVQKIAAPYKPGTTDSNRVQHAGDSAEYVQYKQNVVVPAASRINERISSYENRLQSWQDLSDQRSYFQLSLDQEIEMLRCQQQVVDILASYRQLHVSLLRSQAIDASRQLLNRRLPEIQNTDISYIEGQCSDLLGSLGHVVKQEAVIQDQVGEALSSLLLQEKYQEVIREYDSLPLGSGQSPGFDATFSYGTALLKTGREYEARRVLNDFFVRTNDLNQVQQGNILELLADLNFGLGDYATAKKRYLELTRVYGGSDSNTSWPRRQLAALDYSYGHTEEVRSYASLLKAFLAYNASRDGFTVVSKARDFQNEYPQSQLKSVVSELAHESEQAAEKWYAKLLAEVDRLSSEQKNQQALELIEKIPAHVLPLDKLAILKLKKASLGHTNQIWTPGDDTIQEEILVAPTQSSPDTTAVSNHPQGTALDTAPEDGLQRTWNQAIADMQAKNYDQSIELFSGLLKTSYGAQARERIHEASLLAAQDSRKEAAELFVRANRATNDQARRQLLLSSRTLLENILRKYPQSGLESKVRRNLNRIEQELAGIDQAM